MADTIPAPTNDRLHDESSSLEALGNIGRTKFYELIRTGELRSVKIGRRRMVPQSEIDRFIANHIG